MSMPGFVFHFRCDACGAISEDYSIFPFPNILRSDITLPGWSLAHKCWSQIQLSLNTDQHTQLESDPERMIWFATSLTSPSLTVCVPRLCNNEGVCGVSVTPDPICPHCAAMCNAIFGYPPREQKLATTDISHEELDIIPVSAIDISVRTRNLCSALGIRTIGQLRNRRDNIVNHKQATDSLIAEVDRWVALSRSHQN